MGAGRWLSVCVAITAACGNSSAPPGAPPAGGQVVISPASVSLPTGGTAQFSAAIAGIQSSEVSWSVREGAAGGSVDGGRYTAPSTEGVYHLVATSWADPAQTAKAAISVSRVELSIAPISARIEPGDTVQFSALASRAADTAVIWSADAGRIDQTGLYTAPSTAGTFHVTATSHFDRTRSATAVVTVRPIAVSLSPKTATLAPNAKQPFTAVVDGSQDARVVWTIAEGAAGGSIDRAGTYTAPSTAGTFHVVAASVANPNRTDTALVTVIRPPGVSISINPAAVVLDPSSTVQFTASVTGSGNQSVIWYRDAGVVWQNGLYQAPSTEGTYFVTVQSRADPSQVAVATVQVSQTPGAPAVEPDQVTIGVGEVVVFRALLPGTADSDIDWSIQEGAAGGAIDALGQYHAPDHEGVFHVVAVSRLDGSKTGTATVSVLRYDLVDHGGSVAPSTRTFLLWWGDVSAFSPDTGTVLEAVLRGLDGTSYLGIADQYLRGARATTSFGGNLFDTTAPPPPNPPESTISDAACAALDANGIAPGPGDMVFVVSSAVFPPGGVALPFCAWHYWGICHGQNLLVAYLPNPKGTSCASMGSGSCNTFSAESTALGTFAAHEFMETITDPFVTGWSDARGAEIGDKCFGIAACVALSTGTLQLQPLYSNAAHACVHP